MSDGKPDMSNVRPLQRRASLIERAAERFDFAAETPRVDPAEAPAAPASVAAPPVHSLLTDIEAAHQPAAAPWTGTIHPLDREKIARAGLLSPDGAVTSTSEEFRIVKRQLLALANADGGKADTRSKFVLVSSAHPGDGKTWVAINLAMSLAAEQDIEVLLVDADFGKPTVCDRLGLPHDGPGLMDLLVDPARAVDTAILHTEYPSLCVMPSGRHVRNDTEVLASDRTRQLFDRLLAGHPRRVVILDSPPALAASLGSELARHVGQTVLVVRADRTSEAALRDAAHLLGACPNIRLLLNRVRFSSSGRQFGSYYGKSAS